MTEILQVQEIFVIAPINLRLTSGMRLALIREFVKDFFFGTQAKFFNLDMIRQETFKGTSFKGSAVCRASVEVPDWFAW